MRTFYAAFSSNLVRWLVFSLVSCLAFFSSVLPLILLHSSLGLPCWCMYFWLFSQEIGKEMELERAGWFFFSFFTLWQNLFNLLLELLCNKKQCKGRPKNWLKCILFLSYVVTNYCFLHSLFIQHRAKKPNFEVHLWQKYHNFEPMLISKWPSISEMAIYSDKILNRGYFLLAQIFILLKFVKSLNHLSSYTMKNRFTKDLNSVHDSFFKAMPSIIVEPFLATLFTLYASKSPNPGWRASLLLFTLFNIPNPGGRACKLLQMAHSTTV